VYHGSIGPYGIAYRRVIGWSYGYLSEVTRRTLPRTTPESSKGSPKVNFLSRQLFSKVNTPYSGAVPIDFTPTNNLARNEAGGERAKQRLDIMCTNHRPLRERNNGIPRRFGKSQPSCRTPRTVPASRVIMKKEKKSTRVRMGGTVFTESLGRYSTHRGVYLRDCINFPASETCYTSASYFIRVIVPHLWTPGTPTQRVTKGKDFVNNPYVNND
jgi:hypothetical protein